MTGPEASGAVEGRPGEGGGVPDPLGGVWRRGLVGLGLGLGLGAALAALVAADPGAPRPGVLLAGVGLAGAVGAVPFAASGWAEVRLRARPALAGLVAWLAWVGTIGVAAVQVLYARQALHGGPDAGFAAVEHALGDLSAVEVRGLGFLAGTIGAFALLPALMVRARAAGERVATVHDLAVAPVPGVGYALFGALVLGLLAGADGVDAETQHSAWASACGGVAMGLVVPLLLLGWCLLPAWATLFVLADRIEARLRREGSS